MAHGRVAGVAARERWLGGIADILPCYPDTRPQALLDKLVITAVSALVHDRDHKRWAPPRLWGQDRDAWKLPPDLTRDRENIDTVQQSSAD